VADNNYDIRRIQYDTKGADLIDVTEAKHVMNVWGGSIDCQHDSWRVDAWTSRPNTTILSVRYRYT